MEKSSIKRVYGFTGEKAEGNKNMKDKLGGKGANLAEMKNLGLPVPDGFTITTDTCNEYHNKDAQFLEALQSEVQDHISNVQKTIGKIFGNEKDPLLFSVRSGSKFSMPGMMDTILNLGLNDKTVEGLANKTNNPRFAYDSYRRFIQMYADVVLLVNKEESEEILHDYKKTKGLKMDTELSANDWKNIVEEFKKLVFEKTGIDFPQDVNVQLNGAIEAVFKSWMNERAIYYRKKEGIPDSLGTAVNVQSMVFGNKGDTSGTGVAFTRNPSTGEKKLFGEYLMNAQGEDVVAGIRTPNEIMALKDSMPHIYKQFVDICDNLEKHYTDMQDIEFTIEEGKLYILQTRNAKRSMNAAIKVAVELVAEGKITKEEAVMRINANDMSQLLAPMIDKKEKTPALSKGLNASPGAVSGKIVFSVASAKTEIAKLTAKEKKGGKGVILVKNETSPEDIEGMDISKGILTATGGATSHAAVVARGMGTPCVCGLSDLQISTDNGTCTIAGQSFKEGDIISIDGTTGKVYSGAIKTIPPTPSLELTQLLEWAKEFKTMAVYANAETPKDVQNAMNFGAEGIGLCRTEHMFFEKDRILNVRKMFLAPSDDARKEALAQLFIAQKSDFSSIFRLTGEKPVTIRLLDAPLHEFLPHKDQETQDVADALGIFKADLEAIKLKYHEANPMLGFRGARVGIKHPEIYEMQVRAILDSAVDIYKETGVWPNPKIMLPVVFGANETANLKKLVEKIAIEITNTRGEEVPYAFGTMIELPAAALNADEIVSQGGSEFFSFGTNDLTQTTLGISRDDCEKFLPSYIENKIIDENPFQVASKPVLELIGISRTKVAAIQQNIPFGVCGEHGGDPTSIKNFHKLGLNSISCSPFRVYTAIIAAAQAKIEEGQNVKTSSTL